VSQFLVEMTETATILHNASRRSLVILDELGRGTSTFDGVAIAYAVVEFIRKRLRCLTLFSTHYHMLLHQYEDMQAEVDMYHMQCMDAAQSISSPGQRVDFMYLYRRGISPKSYGMNVALMAGLPPEVVEKAAQISEEFERKCNVGRKAAMEDTVTQRTKKQLTREEVEKIRQLLATLRVRHA
jgi:DNA mismatch repair protein MSH6